MKSRPVSLCLKVSPPSTAGSLGFFMVYIFFLFATVKPPVNSPGWFTCSENNVRHTALIGDERLQERLFVSVKPTSASSARPPPLSVPSRVCLRHFVWTRAKVPICCVSRFSAHGACTHDSLHISMCVCVCVCDVFCRIICGVLRRPNPTLMQRRHMSAYVCAAQEGQFLECRHKPSRWVLGALAPWCVCVSRQENLICVTMNM